MNVEYLYLPDKVGKILRTFPFLSKKISNFHNEGNLSVAFPAARKSQREIYRILSNQHYAHLVDLLHSIENTLSNGYQNLEILKIRNTSQFFSGITEVLVSDYFIKKEFEIKGFDTIKKQSRVPDIYASSKQYSFVAEIYKPRDWEGLDLYINDITLFLKNMDVPIDFICNINLSLIKTLNETWGLLVFDPWSFSSEMEKQSIRHKKTNQITSAISKKLKNTTNSEIYETFFYEDFNLKITVSLREIEKPQGDYPSRTISYHKPTLTGYAPELMFEHLLNKKIIKKMAKRQTIKVQADLTVLIVDITSLAYKEEFDYPMYFEMFKKSTIEIIKEDTLTVDILVFCIPKLKSELTVKLLLKKEHIKQDIIESLFGSINSELVIMPNKSNHIDP